MSNAIGLFLRQIVLQHGIPFDIKLPQGRPLVIDELSEDQFNQEMGKGISDMEHHKVVSAESVAERMQQDYEV